MSCLYYLHIKVEKLVGGAFERYGRFISRHPWKVIVLVVIMDIGFGCGLLNLTTETSIEQYAPTNSDAMKHRDWVKSTFNINISTNFYTQSMIELGRYATIITQRTDGGNMVNSTLWTELSALLNYVTSTTITDGGTSYNYTDLCAKQISTCVIDGGYIFSTTFITALGTNTVPSPVFLMSGIPFTIKNTFGGATSAGGVLTSATAIKLTFHLSVMNIDLASKWEDAFLERMKVYSSNTFTIVYEHSASLNKELNVNISSDITFFSVTFTLMIMFAGFVLMGGNCVSNRYNLGMVGVLSTGLAIVAALGIVSAVGVKFVGIVGTMPFLIIGIGIDDMFVLLSGLADTSSLGDIETRIGKTMRHSGIAITITSLTDVIAFCAGASSIFPAVRYFSWYTGTAILLCYLNYVTFYLGCMTINEKRVSQNRHFLTCRLTQSNQAMEEEGTPSTKILCCAGSPQLHRNDVEGPLEKYPKMVFKRIVSFTPTKIMILVVFGAIIGVSVYGAFHFQEGLDRKDLVTEDSYYHTFHVTNTRLYDQIFPISLFFKSGVDYRSRTTLDAINSLRNNVRNDTSIDDNFFLSWLHAYMISSNYDNSSTTSFVSGLQTYLATIPGNVYINDVTIDGTTIIASRIHVLTEHMATSSEEASMMIRMKNAMAASSLHVFAYSPAFIFIEQYAAIYSQTLQTLGICVGVVFLITAIFLPLPIMILFITMSVVLIMLSVIGFMHFWNLTLSSVTMIHIVMCIGFCVDFSTHVCHAFVQSEGNDKDKRVELALNRSGGPILNGALSTIIGVSMLIFSNSFIFFSFFKVMFLVMVFGLMYSMLLLPVLLSFLGPHYMHVEKMTSTVEDAEINSVSELRQLEDKSV